MRTSERPSLVDDRYHQPIITARLQVTSYHTVNARDGFNHSGSALLLFWTREAITSPSRVFESTCLVVNTDKNNERRAKSHKHIPPQALPHASSNVCTYKPFDLQVAYGREGNDCEDMIAMA